MKPRMITGLVLSIVIALNIYLLRPFSIAASNILVLFFGVYACYEMVKANHKGGNNAIMSISVLSPIITLIMFLWLQSAGIIIALLISSMIALSIFTFKKLPLNDLVSTLSIIVYPQIFTSLFYILNSNTGYGLLAVTLMLAVAILTDSMAMFSGMIFKGKKLCPTISPKKTISGAIGGIVGGIMGAMLTFLMFSVIGLFDNTNNVTITVLSNSKGIEVLFYIAIGIFGSIADQVGDLCASAVKRRVNIKDYSKIFPGHGGVMDRLDGMVFVLPVVYIAMIILFG